MTDQQIDVNIKQIGRFYEVSVTFAGTIVTDSELYDAEEMETFVASLYAMWDYYKNRRW